MDAPLVCCCYLSNIFYSLLLAFTRLIRRTFETETLAQPQAHSSAYEMSSEHYRPAPEPERQRMTRETFESINSNQFCHVNSTDWLAKQLDGRRALATYYFPNNLTNRCKVRGSERTTTQQYTHTQTAILL